MTDVRKMEYADIVYNCRIYSHLTGHEQRCQLTKPNCTKCGYRDRGLELLRSRDKLVKEWAEVSKQAWEVKEG